MHSSKSAPARSASFSASFLFSTALTSALFTLCCQPAAAQQTASPETKLPEIKGTAPQPRPPATPRTRTATGARPVTPARATEATLTETPPTAAVDPVVYSATGVATPARETTSSVTVINRQQLE